MRYCAIAFVLIFGLAVAVQAQVSRISLAPVISGLSQPVFLTNARDGSNRKFIVEQVGRIRVVQQGAANATPFLDITSRVLSGGERGLLGLAFHPQFAANGRFYVNYTRRPDGATVVAEYRNGVERILFTVAQPYENHNGGMIEFGPDGYLYIGMGDGGSGNDPQNHAQNVNDLLGKMLRINVDIPNARPEIFAYGFRNPWRFSFDRWTGQLYAGDVGQGAREEIDIVMRGGNYGWRVWEGTQCTGLGPAPCSTPGFIPPIADYVNTGDNGRCAVIGGYVYRGTQASLPLGAYVYGDLCSGEIFMLKDGVQTMLLDTPFQISSFGEDEAGEIYVLNIAGSILRLTNPDAVSTSERQFAIADGGAFIAATAGSAGESTVGYARVQSDAGHPLPAGLAIFGFQQKGILVSEATVPIAPLVSQGRIFAEVNSSVNTGLALANPSDAAAIVEFAFRDANGNASGTGALVIQPRQQISAFLNQSPFNGSDSILGTFTFTSTSPLSSIAFRGFINERSEFLLTTLPVMSVANSPNSPAVIPHYAEGAGWTTDIVIVSRGAAATGTVQFLDGSGHIVRTSEYNVAAAGSTRIQTVGGESIMRTGSVRLIPAVDAFCIFSYSSNGVTVTMAGVPGLPAGTAFLTYVESAGTIRSGIAISNPLSSASTVNLELSGFTASIDLPANGQRAFFVSEIPEFAGLPIPFQGILRITSGGPVVVTGLRGRTNERGEFLITAAPPFDEDSNQIESELAFPHVVDGGGYGMQFILFGPPTSGTMYFVDRSGTPLSLLFR